MSIQWLRLDPLLRFLVLMTFTLWQGGFSFYGGFVVPIGSKILGSDTLQGFITQSVTNALNGIGVITVFVWAIAMLFSQSKCPRFCWGLWGFVGILLILMLWIHGRMDMLLDFQNRDVLDADVFHRWHRVYLTLSTLQWLVSIVWVAWMLSEKTTREDIRGR